MYIVGSAGKGDYSLYFVMGCGLIVPEGGFLCMREKMVEDM